jgi:hypothetical protein
MSPTEMEQCWPGRAVKITWAFLRNSARLTAPSASPTQKQTAGRESHKRDDQEYRTTKCCKVWSFPVAEVGKTMCQARQACLGQVQGNATQQRAQNDKRRVMAEVPFALHLSAVASRASHSSFTFAQRPASGAPAT